MNNRLRTFGSVQHETQQRIQHFGSILTPFPYCSDGAATVGATFSATTRWPTCGNNVRRCTGPRQSPAALQLHDKMGSCIGTREGALVWVDMFRRISAPYPSPTHSDGAVAYPSELYNGLRGMSSCSRSISESFQIACHHGWR